MTPSSVTAPSSPSAIDWLAVLSKLSNAPSGGDAASFDVTLGKFLGSKSGEVKGSSPKGAAATAAGKSERGRPPVEKKAQLAAKESASEVRGAEERAGADKESGKVTTEHSALSAKESMPADEESVSENVSAGQEEEVAAATESAVSDKEVESAPRRQGERGKTGEATGSAALSAQDLSGQVLARLQRLGMAHGAVATGDSAARAGAGQGTMTPEELLMQLSLLGIAGQNGESEQQIPQVMAEAGNKVVAALLPTATMAQMVEKMMQGRVLAKSGTEEVAEVLGKLQAVTDGGVATEGSLRVSGNSRAVSGGGSLSAQSPQFADELVDRVGKMRLLTRGGMTDQLRVTLDPEDLGSIDLRVRVDGQNQVHLMITTQSEATKELLHRQMGQLREALARQEMGFGDVIVQVGDQEQQEQYAAAQWSFADQQAQRENLLARGLGRLSEEPSVRVDPLELIRRPPVSVSEGLSIIV
ncbi:flagellar hook-length control protein FliK [Candidatus Magnetaquicoccus inordinatus]|uniref:flagellar hook-length control protein FliK n=1 Tax=Candidatus Magnetaquicoccus inordinatus TaxID=2496818 RepID=UPI00187D2B87|nr:flagellar hook-length control protein FliK [Candidatus Magnetaquicoccus inordinatus]